MAYINTDTLQYPVSELDIRALHPNTSFPEPFTAPEPYAWVFPAPQPSYDPIAQTVRETTPAITAKGNWEQQWEVVYLPADQVLANQTAKAAQDLIARKAERQSAIDTLTVTIDGMVFDGDETSQTRMARAIVVMQAASIPTISWVLHDNTVATVTVTQLTQALAAAGAEQARLWVLPYEAVSA